MPFASPSAMAALGECKAAWGLERWKGLNAATKTKLWNARRAGDGGWTPPDFTPANVTPSPESISKREKAAELCRRGDLFLSRGHLHEALECVGEGLALHPTSKDLRALRERIADDSSSGEEEVVESGRVPDPLARAGILKAPAPAAPRCFLPETAAAFPETPEKEDDGLSGLLSSLALAPAAPAPVSTAAAPASKSAALPTAETAAPPKDAAAAKDTGVDALDAALASINLGPATETPQKAKSGGPAWDSLRPYQRALVLDVEDRLHSPRARTEARPFSSVICSLATGGGKTRVAAAFLERNCSGSPALFVVNRTVLALQAQEALREYCAVVEWGKDTPHLKALADDRPTVYVATIQGLRASGALKRPFDTVKCVVLDEAHGAAADTYLALLFEGLKTNSACKVLGLTATPFRLARDAVLGSAFSSAARGPTVQELVALKALAPPKVVASTPRDRVEARGADEDATEASLATRLWLRAQRAGAKTAVAFCRDIRRSRLLVDVLRGAGVRAEHLDGSTPEKARRRILAELRAGVVEVVANASLLAEGFDEPSLSAVILARPTQSTALFVQQVGRALRPFPNKACGFVVDVIGAAEQHGSAFGRLYRLEPDDGGALARGLSDRAAADPPRFGYIADRVAADAPPTFQLSAQKAPRRRGIAQGPPPPPDLLALGRKPNRPPPPPDEVVALGSMYRGGAPAASSTPPSRRHHHARIPDPSF